MRLRDRERLALRPRGISAMAVVKAFTQPLSGGDTHGSLLKKLLSSTGASEFVVSTAYVNAAGVVPIADKLSALGSKVTAYIGVRNGASTFQGAAALLKLGANLHVVDTGTSRRIFHPKVYFNRSADKAQLIVGSANLTHAGLHNNIEFSTWIELALADPADKKCIDDFQHALAALPVDHPQNCFKVTTEAQLKAMLAAGILEDERISKPFQGAGFGVGTGTGAGAVPAIALPFVFPTKLAATAAPAALPPPPSPPTAVPPAFGPVLWVKPSLPNSDLQLNTASSVPGVLRLTQAKFEVGGALINHATYFRNVAFGALPWTVDPTDPGKEIAPVVVDLVIAGLFVGQFSLRLSYKAAWAAGQGNYTTGLHWDSAVGHIKNSALLGRPLTIYGPLGPGRPFGISID